MIRCQSCHSYDLQFVLSLGWLPPPNDFRPLDVAGDEQVWMPTDLYFCLDCSLVQLGYTGAPKTVFPAHYPYTSGATKILRENFANLQAEMQTMLGLKPSDLIIDIGSNDGTLLSNFIAGHRVLGVEPTDIANLANKRNIPTRKAFFGLETAQGIDRDYRGTAKRTIVTCANCFAHMANLPDVMAGIKLLISSNGVFVSESHYVVNLIHDLQYDTIYHEHLRYYSIRSIKRLLERYGLEVFHVVPIPTHGGGIRVYAAMPGLYPIEPSVAAMLKEEPDEHLILEALERFAKDVWLSKMRLTTRILEAELAGEQVAGISAPSRAATVINYCRLELPYIAEIKDSLKLGKYMPGTSIPVVDEEILFGRHQPQSAVLFSWHIADELIPKLRSKGYKGKIILPCERVELS